MKKTLLALLLSSLYVVLFSQTIDSTFYYTSEGKATSKKSRAEYYLISKTKGKFRNEILFDKKDNKISQYNYQSRESSDKADAQWYKYGQFFEWQKNNILYKEGGYLWGLKEGDFKEYYPSGKLKIKDTYHLDTLTKSVFYDENGKDYLVSELGMPKAVYPGGESVLYKYLASNFKMPLYIMRQYEKIYMVLKITVGEDGIARDPLVLGIKDKEIDKQWAQILKKMPRFQPALKNNQPVESTLLLPFNMTFFTTSSTSFFPSGRF